MQLIQLIIDGVASGCIYSWSLGFVLIYKARNHQFAQGDILNTCLYFYHRRWNEPDCGFVLTVISSLYLDFLRCRCCKTNYWSASFCNCYANNWSWFHI